MATKRDTGPWLAPRSGGYTARSVDVPPETVRKTRSAAAKILPPKPLPPKGRAAPSTTTKATSKSAA